MRIILILIVLILGAGGYFGYRFLDAAGAFRELAAVPAQSCERVTGAPGAEDFQIDRAAGLLYVSSQDRRLEDGQEAPRGGIFVLDLNNPSAGFTELTAQEASGAPEDFHPHGLSLAVEAGSPGRIAVINHTQEERDGKRVPLHTVELFAIMPPATDAPGSPPRLVHQRTFSDPAFVSPNDVVLLGGGFYLTNDHYYGAGVLQQIETFFRRSITNVVYYDGVAGTVAADGLTYANGINASPDGSVIYVAETSDGTLRVYDRDRVTGALTLRAGGLIDLNSGLDNIDVAQDGTLWIGAHPNLLRFIAHAGNEAEKSPSEIIRAKIKPDGSIDTTKTVYLDAVGEEISGSSVAALYQGKLIIGSVFEDHILICSPGE